MKPEALPAAGNDRSTFLIVPAGTGWQIRVTRHGRLDGEPIPAATKAEALRLARPLSAAGLLGFIRETPWPC